MDIRPPSGIFHQRQGHIYKEFGIKFKLLSMLQNIYTKIKIDIQLNTKKTKLNTNKYI